MAFLGNHPGFILVSYGLTVVVMALLFAWIVVDGRAQRRQLAELEARGIKRRSGRTSSGDAA